VDNSGDNFSKIVDNFFSQAIESYPHTYPHDFVDNFFYPTILFIFYQKKAPFLSKKRSYPQLLIVLI